MRAVLFISILVLASACISTTPNEPTPTTVTTTLPACVKPSDCSGRHQSCYGHWTCAGGRCRWECASRLDGFTEQSGRLEYTVGGCDFKRGSRRNNKTVIKAVDDNIIVNQTLSYYCCASIGLEVERKRNTYTIREVNHGKVCRCMCDYTINAVLKMPGKGRYDVEVRGVEFQKEKGAILGKEKITIS
ncbi:MAG: hypothetical protein ABIH11_06680 [Candidatus Altiarchaeota archaeon]